MSVLESDTVPPGGETKITATLNTRNHTGHMSKSITVTSNDPDTPVILLTLKVYIRVDVEVIPPGLHFGRLVWHETASKAFTLKTDPAKNIKILSVTPNDDRFSVEHLDGDLAGDASYRLDFAGSNEIGNIAAKVIVRYTASEEQEIEIPVQVGIQGPLRYPASIHFFKRPDGFAAQKIAITAGPGKTVRIEQAVDPDSLLDLQILRPEGEEAIIEAKVSHPDREYLSSESHKIMVKTDSVDMPNLEIIYRIIVRS